MKIRKSIKTLCGEAEQLIHGGVKTRDDFLKAVPMFFELKGAIDHFNQMAEMVALLASKVSSLAADYGDAHPKAFDVPMHDVRAGIRQATVQIGDKEYTLTLSLGCPKREDGGNMTADFISGLPKDWLKTTQSLDWTKVKKLPDVDGALKAHGLFRQENRLWSETTTVGVGDQP